MLIGKSARRSEAATSKPAKDSLLFVTSFAKGLKILEAFSLEKRSMSLMQLAEASGVDKSGVQRFTHTLHALGYLDKDPVTKHYRLGAKTLQLSSVYLRSDELIGRSQSIIEEYNNLTGETINLSRLQDTEIVYLIRLPSRHAVSVNITPGTRLPAFCSAMGRAILAFLPPAEVKAIIGRSDLERFTPQTLVNPRDITRCLQDVQRDGFAITDQEIHVGDISVASPVFDHSGRVVAGVGIAVPNSRWSVDSVRLELAPKAVELAKALSSLV